MMHSVAAPVLFVDLDGTLVATDVMREALLLASYSAPWAAVRFFASAMKGRAEAKRVLAERVQPDVQRLPYQQDVLDFLRNEKKQGRQLVLATASDMIWAEAVASHVGLFNDVIASDGQRNLKGAGKLVAIQSYCRQRGLETFAYMGDAKVDLPIWEQAEQIYVVAPTPLLLDAIRRIAEPTRIFGTSSVS